MGEIRIVSPGKTRGHPYPVCKKKQSYTERKKIFFFKKFRNIRFDKYLVSLSSELKSNQPYIAKYINLGPVVQSIVSLTSSLRGQLVKCFMTL